MNKKFLNSSKTKILLAILVVICSIVAIAPATPEIQYKFRKRMKLQYAEEDIFLNDDDERIKNLQTEHESGNLRERMLVIPTIGVYIDIVEGDSEEALSRGAWRRPNSSTPDKGGNTVITAHRFQYVPPNNKTFYNLDKLEEGEKILIYWQEIEYIYQVDDIFVVTPIQLSIEENTEEDILTLYTCHPLWTANNRYVVRASLIKTQEYLSSVENF